MVTSTLDAECIMEWSGRVELHSRLFFFLGLVLLILVIGSCVDTAQVRLWCV